MKLIQTVAGVLAIVGLGYIAGVGQSLLRERPVILGPAIDDGGQSDPKNGSEPNSDSDPGTDPGTTDSAQDAPDTDPVASPPSIDEPEVIDPDVPDLNQSDSTSIDPEYDARLDAPVPEGMITLRRAHQLWMDGAYFVDARHDYEFEAGHISAAAHLTAETIFTEAGEAEMQSIPPDATVVIYCVGGEECDASQNTMALLQSFGYSDLLIMGVGFEEWQAAGLPTGSGAKP